MVCSGKAFKSGRSGMVSMNVLEERYPLLGERLPRVPLAALPTPVRQFKLDHDGVAASIWVKLDNETAAIFGGNKVRKLEYLFGRIDHGRFERVATFGTVASNHALATALYATHLGFASTCFLYHQTKTKLARAALNMHLRNGTEVVPFAGSYARRLAIERQYLWHRRSSVIPMGGSSWSGTAAFVNAGLELAEQIMQGKLPCPDRIYLAAGTMGSAAGLAIGLATEALPVAIEAVRVSPSSVCNEPALLRLMKKTCLMLHRIDDRFPRDAWRETRVRMRHDYFGAGYAKSTPKADAAMAAAAAATGLDLEVTYTGKAMAALLDDFAACHRRGERQLFWQTCHTGGLPVETGRPGDPKALPDAFLSYFD